MSSKRNGKIAKLVIVVNVDWFFLSHRLPIALGAQQAGYDVHVIAAITEHRAQLESYGFNVHHMSFDRNNSNPVHLIKVFWQLYSLLKILKPEIVHFVTIKPVLIGGLAARFVPIQGVVYAISGLGHVFIANGLLGTLRRMLVGLLYRFILHAPNMRIIFQNPDDRKAIESVARLTSDKMVIIPGSGVDLTEYSYTTPPEGEVVVMLIARLLKTKGIHEFVASAEHLQLQGVRARFILVGAVDEDNPARIHDTELDKWRKEGYVELFGNRSDVATLLSRAHIVVLPSYREGLPKILIEAAASGRVVITTDVPGCRDAIEAGVTGLLIPPKDIPALSAAICTLVNDLPLCVEMGRAGRERAEHIFDVRSVVATHLQIYQQLLAST